MLSVLTFRTPDEAVEKANNTPYGLSRGRLDGEGLAHPLDGAAAARRRRLGEHVQPLRPGVAVRRLQGVRLRPRGRPARPRAVPEVRRSDGRLPVKKTYKLYIGGAFPRSESGRTYEAEGAERRARLAQGRARRGARGARGASRSGSGMTAYNRGQVLYRVAEMMEARRAELAAVCSGPRRRSSASIDRVVWYAGWADKLAQVLGGVEPGRRPVLQLHGARADRRRRRSSRPTSRRSRGSSRASLPALVGGNAVVAVASESQPARRDRARRGARDLRRARRRRQHPHRLAATSSRPVLAGHMDVNAIDLTGADGDAAELERLAAENVKRVVRGTPTAQSLWEIAPLPRAEDRLAPDRALEPRRRRQPPLAVAAARAAPDVDPAHQRPRLDPDERPRARRGRGDAVAVAAHQRKAGELHTRTFGHPDRRAAHDRDRRHSRLAGREARSAEIEVAAAHQVDDHRLVVATSSARSLPPMTETSQRRFRACPRGACASGRSAVSASSCSWVRAS